MAKYITHTFYCTKCGQPTIPIQRVDGRMRGKFHRKKLYCWHCKEEINCIECRTDEEVVEFKEMFENGDFIEEAQESLEYCRSNTI